ncbi:hypothetical protein MNBD_UNCLBAC01-1612 [hydrothermal vent metagenome]|uniref:DUF6798 domain-containing protein n=1 Tax=hydrothermal vent metagenome TaxID=652676 RepID=A0A3B1DE20_9ZZZZ
MSGKSSVKDKFLIVIQSSWFIAAVLLAVFFLSTSYKYAWDDQHLEIPLLKHLIDDSLYEGDYYVESLEKNFSSYFYPVLAKLINVKQIPATYFFLYIISRYFLFFWIYKLWLWISKNKWHAIACVLTSILVTRVNEFLYRTFSHQEFTLPIIFSGIYYFFRGRFLLASAILGAAANLHALYSLFPFLFMLFYLLINIRTYGYKPFLKSISVFTLFCLPFLIWMIKNRLGSSMEMEGGGHENWISLFIAACPQNFFFSQAPQIPLERLLGSWKIFFGATQSYLYILLLFGMNLFCNESFRKNKRVLSFCIGAFGLLGICLIGTYFYPSRLIIDLNLTRNTQFLLFILIGYTTLFTLQTVERKPIWIGLCFGLLFSLLKLPGEISMLSVGLMFSFGMGLGSITKKSYTKYFLGISSILIGLSCAYGIFHFFKITPYNPTIQWVAKIILILLLINTTICWLFKNKSYALVFHRLFIFIPLMVFLVQFAYYRNQRIQEEVHGGGFWELQRHWEDMQKYTKLNTPKEAMILVPYNMEMGGFRILSERKIICSYRDCGIVGFDYKAAQEWQQRVKDIEAFKFITKSLPKKAVENAMFKYKADYIVFMSYAAPPKINKYFQHIYSNKYFSLFKVLKF